MCMYLHTCILTLDKSNLFFGLGAVKGAVEGAVEGGVGGAGSVWEACIYRKKLCQLDETKDAKLIFLLTTRGTFISSSD